MKSFLEKLPFYNQAVLPYHYAQSLVAGVRYGFPGKHLRVIGVTGTNGKTTTAFMIWRMLSHSGFKTGLMTTVAWGVDTLTPELGHMTTVDAITLNKRIASIRSQGAEFLVLEVTSHALAQFRTLGIPIEIAAFTNLTHDHLDYHKTFTAYRAAKGKLFRKAKFSILNSDDSATKYYKTIATQYITYGINSGQYRATNIKLSVHGVKYSLGDISIETRIPGEFNVYNSMAAALVGQQLGLTAKQIHDGIYALDTVEGRMNIVDEGQVASLPFMAVLAGATPPPALFAVRYLPSIQILLLSLKMILAMKTRPR